MKINKIRAIVGQPTDGKTFAMIREASDAVQDANNFVVIAGRENEYENVANVANNNLVIVNPEFIEKAVYKAIKAKRISKANGVEDDTRVYIFIDSGTYHFDDTDRCLLEGAMKAGIDIAVVMQHFSILDGGDVAWLEDNCETMTVSKYRQPRIISFNEMMRMR